MDYQQYYTNQAGSGYPVFHGTRFQRGYGLGNIFRGLIRWITPIIKTHALPALAAGSKEIGREAIKTFSNVATDTLNGRQFNQVFKERGSEAINSLNLFLTETKNEQKKIFLIMSFLHKQSYECSKTELDLFEVPPTQVSFEAARIVEYYPISVADNGPIEFFISGSSDEYIDLSQTFLYIKAEGTGQNKSHSLANNLLHAMFQQVDVSLNETLVTASVNTYPYRAIMETLLNYGSDAKDSHCTASLFYKDTAENMNKYDGTNPGGQIRSKIAALNSTFDMYGRLHVDLFFQDRLLINNVNVRVKLHRSKNSFCFVSDGTPALRILSAMLHVRKVRVNPKIMYAHATVLKKTTIKYPIKRVETKTFKISSGVASITLDNVSLEPLPKKIVLALVTSKAYNGD